MCYIWQQSLWTSFRTSPDTAIHAFLSFSFCQPLYGVHASSLSHFPFSSAALSSSASCSTGWAKFVCKYSLSVTVFYSVFISCLQSPPVAVCPHAICSLLTFLSPTSWIGPLVKNITVKLYLKTSSLPNWPYYTYCNVKGQVYTLNHHKLSVFITIKTNSSYVLINTRSYSKSVLFQTEIMGKDKLYWVAALFPCSEEKEDLFTGNSLSCLHSCDSCLLSSSLLCVRSYYRTLTHADCPGLVFVLFLERSSTIRKWFRSYFSMVKTLRRLWLCFIAFAAATVDTNNLKQHLPASLKHVWTHF